MRRLVSKEDEAGKRKRNRIIAGVVLAVVMILSTIGFAFQGRSDNASTGNQSESEIDYNGFKFINQNGLWILGNFVFRYNPNEVENIGTGIKPLSNYQGKPAYIYSEDEEAEIEVAGNIGLVAQRVQKACSKEMNCTEDIPVKTCSDNFIIIKESDITSIVQNNSCVLIKGPKENLTSIADGFLFKALEIR
ncbi:MAG: hypothetical protein NTW17_03080 [Candidatus Pacearchaeota archaeon]|nr:hypothetical protein [Candidatus Pacearchaeota archaeon]